MAKKQDNTIFWIIGTIILVIIVLPKLDFQKFSIQNVEEIPSEIKGGTCSITIYPPTITQGQLATGTIIASPSTICAVYVNLGAGYVELTRQPTNSAGVLSITQPLTQSGNYLFYADCGDCQTNKATLNVLAIIDTDGDGIPDSIDTDDDNDGYTDSEEAERGTDPLNSNSTPFDCSTYCQNLETSFSELYDGFWTSTLSICEDESWGLCPTNHIHIYSRGGNNCCCLVCLDENHDPYPY